MACCGRGIELSEVNQRATRLGIAVLIAGVIGFGLILPDEGIHIAHAKEFSNGLKWSAITCVVVSAPVIGRVAQTGAERILGTVVGGFLGFGVYSVGALFWTPLSDGVILSVMAALVAFTSVTIGAAYGLENSTKLYALTFMLVTFGSDSLHSTSGSLRLALTRILGICFGVLLSEVTSVLIFPKSATGEALLLLRQALGSLTELNAMAWQHGPLFRPGWESMLPDGDSGKGGFPVMGSAPLKAEAWLADAEEREKRFEKECERMLMDIYNCVNKVTEYLPQARSEVYLGHMRRQLCFLPGIPWLQLGRAVLPQADVQETVTSVRRVARLLWAIHLSFQQGFDLNMLEMLKQQYPPRLMPELARQTQGCLRDLYDSFPNASAVPRAHLHGLVSAVESLLRISDYQRRRILHYMKRSHVGDSDEASDGGNQTPSPDGPAAAEQPAPHTPPKGLTNLRQLTMSRAASAAVPGPDSREYSLSRTKSKRYESIVGAASLLQPDSPEPFAEAARSGSAGLAGAARMNRYSMRERPGAPEGLTAPLLGGGTASHRVHWDDRTEPPTSAFGLPASTRPQGGEPSRQGVNVPGPAGSTGMASTSTAAYYGSPNEVFTDLPNGLSIAVRSSSRVSAGNTYDIEMGPDEEDIQAVHVRLQRVPSGELIVFPETAEGYVDKVRWYSFQFLMEELTEEIEIMHHTIGNLLRKLPQPCLAV